jgi:hypothetical protein
MKWHNGTGCDNERSDPILCVTPFFVTFFVAFFGPSLFFGVTPFFGVGILWGHASPGDIGRFHGGEMQRTAGIGVESGAIVR